MIFDYRQIFQRAILSLFLVMSCVALFLGVALITMKSPEDKAQIYLAEANYDMKDVDGLDIAAQENLLQHSYDLTVQAVSLTPYNEDLWTKLMTLKADKHKQSLRHVDSSHHIALSDLK